MICFWYIGLLTAELNYKIRNFNDNTLSIEYGYNKKEEVNE